MARGRLFDALEQAFPVTFGAEPSGRHDVVGEIVIGPPGELSSGRRGPGKATLPAIAFPGAPESSTAREPFTLQHATLVDQRVRGISLSDRFAEPPSAPPEDAQEVLGTAGRQPVWTVSRGPAALQTVRSVLPELSPSEVLYALVSKHPLSAIALIQFLREVSAPSRLDPPPLRAAFLFDDPNLRWRSYGHIDYKRLVAHADEHGYHAAMAMIPLDAGRPHPPTAELFRRRADRISLVVHGNDHTRRELLAPRSDAAALAIAAQALRRIARFERRCGLTVDRVMTPPHGLCSQQVTRALGAVGFDALSAIHPLPWTEEPPEGPLLAGWRGADFVAGCAVLPRIPFGGSTADFALRAFLDHPLIVYGHHQDLAEGIDALVAIAETINRLGPVRWMSVGEIVNSNAERRVSGARITVMPLTRRLRLTVPAVVRELVVERPLDSLDAGALDGFSISGGGDTDTVNPFGSAVSISGSGERAVQIRLDGRHDVDPWRIPPPPWRPWPKVRRAVTEIRDRASVREIV